jgi:hypothetical protein
VIELYCPSCRSFKPATLHLTDCTKYICIICDNVYSLCQSNESLLDDRIIELSEINWSKE